mmetsp:Transcript_60774/g.177587  ORF Transcript_60774/g.177587 Transcript_60774/m.177587 type:complete len:159 (+) Transcript_60774:103-579(+)
MALALAAPTTALLAALLAAAAGSAPPPDCGAEAADETPLLQVGSSQHRSGAAAAKEESAGTAVNPAAGAPGGAAATGGLGDGWGVFDTSTWPKAEFQYNDGITKVDVETRMMVLPDLTIQQEIPETMPAKVKETMRGIIDTIKKTVTDHSKLDIKIER